MGDRKPEGLDFVKNFQDYLSRQTCQVNLLSGLAAGAEGEGGPEALGCPAAEATLAEHPGLAPDDLQRTLDGKLRCPYCSYASQRAARLVEHTRIHTGEKPHRCRLCPFASAYERYLEAHMRSHTGEKPYQCELCPYRCSYGSNLSHHRRRRHKVLPTKRARKMWEALQKRSSHAQEGGAVGAPSEGAPKPAYLDDFAHKMPHLQDDIYESGAKASLGADPEDLLLVDNPLNQLSALAGQLSALPPEHQTTAFQDIISCPDERPFVMQQPSVPPVPPALPAGVAGSSSPKSPEPGPSPGAPNCSPVAGPSSEPSGHTSTASLGNSSRSTPTPLLLAQDAERLRHCPHCHTYFADNVLYTIHMGCHGYDNPLQCNVCGCKCKSKYDFACHFARGQHNRH